MPEGREISFITEKSARYRPEFDAVNCERVRQADIDGDGCMEIVVARYGSSRGSSAGEIAVYDLDLNLKAYDSWDGTAMDVVIADVDGDGTAEIVVAGGLKNSMPMIRVYKYDENYKDNLQLISQIAWKTPEGLFGTAKSLYVDSQANIAVLTAVEGNRENTGYAQLRIYDADMQLKKVARWTPMSGQVVKWGHCMMAVDMDGDGCDELVTLINFRHDGKQKADLRVFDLNLVLKRRCESLADQSLFATCMSAADIDGDGKAEIVVAGGAFTEVWSGATNQLMAFNGDLELKSSTTWKTFRHSWVWDLQIADVDGDGVREIITYGGAAMEGTNQENANIMGEIRIWDGGSLTTKDMFIWRSKPGEDTRPSRGFALKDGECTRFAIATSKWSRVNPAAELEIRTLKYEPAAGVVERYSEFITAYEEKNVEALGAFVHLEDTAISPIALNALALCGGKDAAKAIGKILKTQDKSLFRYTVGLLKFIGAEALDELRQAGFSVTDDWAIISPFDNQNNMGFDQQYPPEAEIDFDAFYAGKDRIVRWGKIEESKWESKRGVYVDLAYNYFDSFERTGIEHEWNVLRTESAAYVLTDIYSPSNMAAQIRIGSADGIKVWLRGELKCSSDTVRDVKIDHDIIPVSLTEGRNRLLLKVANHKANRWGFHLRVTDANGNPVPGLRYERPAVSHIHNQMLTNRQLIALLDVQDDPLRCLAASQLASSGDKRGNETLSLLLESEDADICARAALALMLAGDRRGLDALVKSAPLQDYRFQVTAGYALRRAGDQRAEQFSITNLKDETGKNILELKTTERNDGFKVIPLFRGDETAHVDVGVDLRFHLGDNISARCARIGSFGIRESKYRVMGLGGIAIRRACEIMAEKGFFCSTVGTGTRLVAHRLYVRHGYVDRRFPWDYGRELGKDATKDDEKIRIRDYSDADKTVVGKLREQYLSNTVGPTNWSPRGNFGRWTRVAENDGGIIGYADVYFDPFQDNAKINLLHIDADYQDEQAAASALLLGIHRYALSEGKEFVSFHDPPMRYRDTLLKTGYRVESHSVRHRWVNMFQIIDLAKLLSEISSLLNLRLQKSVHAGWTGSIGIIGSRLKATLVIDKDGGVNIEDANANADISIIADDGIITSLVSGDCDVWECYRQHTLTISPMFNERIRNLIETLFPIMACRQSGWW